MRVDFDVLVVGAGLMGSATAWSAARHGASVAVLEQFSPHHSLGSSHGSARIVRRAYGDPLYTRLTARAFDLWRELELANDVQLIRQLGGLDFGRRSDVTTVAENLTAAEVPHEVLDSVEAERRWPGLRFSGPVVFHEQAGTVDAERAVDVFLADARRHGAAAHFETAARSVTVRGDDLAEVRTNGEVIRARRVVLAPGAWLANLAGGLVRLPELRVTQQQIAHFPRLDPTAPPWPSVIHHGQPAIYHLAGGRDGTAADDRKLARHDGGTVTSGIPLDRSLDPSATAELVHYVRRWLPGLEPTPRAEVTCLYTSTPSEDFLLDRVGPLVICSACSGHGAKFAPLIGELAADLALGSGDEVPGRFRLAAHRPARIDGGSLGAGRLSSHQVELDPVDQGAVVDRPGMGGPRTQ
jgi:monomeric sarcosine oxidase